jgi:hypothetical protein
VMMLLFVRNSPDAVQPAATTSHYFWAAAKNRQSHWKAA